MQCSKKLMKDFRPQSPDRIKGLEIFKQIVYGNIARTITNHPNGHTHEWKLYVKPYKNEELSGYIKQVKIKLPKSYANAERTLTKPPYEIQETGWEEFEVAITIHFLDPRERTVTLYHYLKLHPSPHVVGIHFTKISGIEYLVYEFYEEIVFREPTKLMKHYLTHVRPLSSGNYTHYTDFKALFKKIHDADEKNKSEILGKITRPPTP